jgi:PAS domain S-box-containing protein
MGAGRELFARRNDGSEFPVEIGLNPVQTPWGRGVLATVVDISPRRRVEQSFLQLVQSAPYGVIVVAVEGDGRIEFVNRMIEVAFGYTAGELIGQQIECLLPQRFRELHVPLRTTYSASPRLHRMGIGRDLMACHRSGSEFPVEIGLAPIFWEGRQCVMAVVTDISDRKLSESALKQANTNLEQFTYVASHDLRSPLHGLAELTDWMQEDIVNGDYAKLQSNLDRVRVRVLRMEKVISDLLAYARAGNPITQLEQVDPSTLLAGILDLIPLPDGFTLHSECRAKPFPAAKVPLETVLRNLIANAVKHHDREQGTVTVRIVEDDRYCRFSVVDDGPGVPEANLERIFKLFQTLSASQRNSSGIGLAISKRLVETHGGHIEVSSGIAEGRRGAEFSFWWPRFPQRDG